MQKKINQFILIFFFIIATSCGTDNSNSLSNTVSSSDSNVEVVCERGTAVIAFFDGISQSLCGCSESQYKRTFQPQSELTCTVSKNTLINFLFFSKTSRIKLQPLSSSSFPDLPLFDPQIENPKTSYGYTFDSAGVFNYSNAFNSLIFGKITVTE